MRAGQLRTPLQLQRATTERAPSGELVPTWSTLVPRLPARLKAAAGGESRQGGERAAVRTVEVEIRWRADVRATDRLLDGATTYEITSCVDPDGRRAALILTCEVRNG